MSIDPFSVLAYTNAIFGVALQRGANDPISGPLCSMLVNPPPSDDPDAKERFTIVLNAISQALVAGTIVDDLCSAILPYATIGSDGAVIRFASLPSTRFQTEAQQRFINCLDAARR